ncbi:MAG: GNAT family N-acetyltransferase [Terriglobales bacterium]
MSEISIRPGTLEDVETVVRHRIEMFRAMGINEEHLAAMEQPARAYFSEAMAKGRYLAFLADDNGKVVAGGGIVLLHWPATASEARDSRPMILNMFTESEYRRRGLARRIMQAMLDWCRQEGYKSVSLHASEYGRPLYESMGFQPTNEMRLNF